MPGQQRDEKEGREEKGRDWKKRHYNRSKGHWGDWCRQDLLDSIGLGMYFVWGALVLLAETTDFAANFTWWNGWGVFFTGAGVITLIATVIRLCTPRYRRKWVAGLIWGFIMLAIGLSVGGWEISAWVWPLLLGTIGITILLRALVRQR